MPETSLSRSGIDVLADLSGGVVRVAQGVLGMGPDELGELDRARAFFERQTRLHPTGSPEYTRALLAAMRLEDLISRRPNQVEVVVPTPQEIEVAIRLQDPGERSWRQGLGMKARRLDTGEAVTLAVAVARKETFGCDEEDGRIAFTALGGAECLSTLELARRATERGLLTERQAREGYERLRREFRFFGPAWR